MMCSRAEVHTLICDMQRNGERGVKKKDYNEEACGKRNVVSRCGNLPLVLQSSLSLLAEWHAGWDGEKEKMWGTARGAGRVTSVLALPRSFRGNKE